ncbi:MAG: C40 family peptidase, partial [Motilibacteraceae bacterium]
AASRSAAALAAAADAARHARALLVQLEGEAAVAAQEAKKLADERAAALEAARRAAAEAPARRAAAAKAAAEREAARKRAARSPSGGSSGNGGGGSGPVSPAGDAAAVAVQVALAQVGKPYVWGAVGPGSFDCSGLMMYAYGKAGVSLPHYSGDQWNVSRPVPLDQLQPGDLVFFGLPSYHVGMYVGGGMMVNAPNPSEPVRVQSIYSEPDPPYAGRVA